MCSIMGYCDVCAAFSDFQKGFLKTVSRGPDDSRIVDTGKGLLGFHRLSIMGLTPSGMQPFERDGSYVVCNGEIYGFEKLKKELEKKYEFVSGSDCEILLPLYFEHGVDMFKMLDAEFALILFDGRTNRMQAMKIHVGDTVRVIAGRKFKKGSVGKVFWCGTCRNPYSGCTEERIGIEVDGNRQFINESQAELIGWEARLQTGKERKRQIRNFAVNSMPSHYRRYFCKNDWLRAAWLGEEPGWRALVGGEQ